MTRYCGKGVCGGIAIGKLHILEKTGQTVEKYQVADSGREVARLEEAKEIAKDEIAFLCEQAAAQVGETDSLIFKIHQMLLEDNQYIGAIRQMIAQQKTNAEYAVSAIADSLGRQFASMEDAYLKERAADVRDISERIIRILKEEKGKKETNVKGEDDEAGKRRAGDGTVRCQPLEPVIILADDLAPSETIQLDKDRVLAFVTVQGAPNSHTAILARTMNLPALIRTEIEISPDLEGRLAVVDGTDGILYVDPDTEILEQMRTRREKELEKKKFLQELKGKKSVTKDGREIMICANIGNVSDLDSARQNDAEGIGLFRSEFLYLESSTYPSEETQFQVYRKVAQAMEGKRAVIRTLDVGADKQADYFELGREENPAMGLRAIRICLKRPDIFKTQLRAIYRASRYGKLAIMYPMITSLWEVRKIKEITAQVREELDMEGIPYDEIEEGIMIETPAAVMISDLLAKEVDFFSIGTNDLAQYTMAIDRQNPGLDAFFDPHHEALLRMIGMVCKNAHAEQIRVGICGELGADPELTERFLKMGVDELSVSPSRVLPLRDTVRKLDLSKAPEWE